MERENPLKKVDLAFLSAFYGGLLTEKQRQVLSLHCEEDLSLGEIAAETGASTATITRVNRSIQYGNGSYEMVFERLKK